MTLKNEGFYSNLSTRANQEVLLKTKKDYVKKFIINIKLLDLFMDENVQHVLNTRYLQNKVTIYFPTETISAKKDVLSLSGKSALPMHIEKYFSKDNPTDTTNLKNYFKYCVESMVAAFDYALEHDMLFDLFECVSKHEGCCLEMPFNEVNAWYVSQISLLDEHSSKTKTKASMI